MKIDSYGETHDHLWNEIPNALELKTSNKPVIGKLYVVAVTPKQTYGYREESEDDIEKILLSIRKELDLSQKGLVTFGLRLRLRKSLIKSICGEEIEDDGSITGMDCFQHLYQLYNIDDLTHPKELQNAVIAALDFQFSEEVEIKHLESLRKADEIRQIKIEKRKIKNKNSDDNDGENVSKSNRCSSQRQTHST